MADKKPKDGEMPENGTPAATDTTKDTDTTKTVDTALATITVSAEELDAIIQARVSEAMNAKAKADAERRTTTGGAISTTPCDPATERRLAMEAERAYLEEYVEVKLFKDNKDYKDDVFVAVNGENCAIKRGVRVKIRRKFALVIEQGELQDVATSEMCDAKSAEFVAAAKSAGVN